MARLDGADPSFPVSLVEADEPPLPRGDWARVAVSAGGICGTDLHTVFPDGTGSPTVLPLIAPGLVMGHEVGGVVTEAGPDCPVPVGARVAVDPMITCAARGLEQCPGCATGSSGACERWNVGHPAGFGHGFATDVGGGWADSLVAHAGQLHVAPDTVDDRALALVEPLSISLHGVLRRPPVGGEPVLVVGAGTIGLAAVVASKAVAPGSEVTVLARHDHQADLATRLGADRVVRTGDDELARLAEVVGGRVTGRGRATAVWGGFPYVVEAAGTAGSLSTALRTVAQRGTLLVLGALTNVSVDLQLLWFKNLDVVGAFAYAVQDHAGRVAHTFDHALDLLAAGRYVPDDVVSHAFPLDQLREAVDVARSKDRGAVKVLLIP